jgi:hypothetical protein
MKKLCIHGGAARLEHAAQNDERVNPTCRVHNTSPLLSDGLPLSFAVLSTTGQVRAEEEAAAGQGTLEVVVEVRLHLRVLVLCLFYRGRLEAEVVVHQVEAEALRCPLRLARREAEAVLGPL